ncbi:hypothetical protein BU25DRAFT_420177 [Macroventuria anomochaeta]|uniref:Uncharacterized protein n=1 Tax=Macroventuria anomochaeta TaxID=301207 RepID=A0ACB6S551_9PLEO|nr:uncharacterized protein BU25DRAFT_420177 [Macroventuria anomochaeta]KAF2629311.1 hypothetical protein BU25DRAFT_420177 [Macroventuria anomochaeta]
MRRALLFCLGLFALLLLIIARFDCRVPSNVIMVNDASAEQMQKGSASTLQASIADPWPLVVRNNQRLRVVKYCYHNQQIRDTLHCKVQHTFQRWAAKLGYPASAQTGHNLGWEEAHDGNADPSQRRVEYCYDHTNLAWNPRADCGSLFISINYKETDGAYATTPYDAQSNEASRYWIMMAPNAGIDAITHEELANIGVVFGMAHEAQRYDRDNHVFYQCHNLKGYNDARAKTMADDSHLTEAEAHRKLCEEEAFARRYNLDSTKYLKNPRGGTPHDEGAFNFDSIMI